jgi:hypothetical protein
MKFYAALSSLGLCFIFSAGPVLAANPLESKGEISTHPGLERQDTGMSDPTVNPGQAAGTRTVRGSVVRSQDGGYVIRDAKKREVKLMVDGETTGDTKLETGDYIKAKVTRQGRAIAIAKEAKKDQQSKKSGK